MEKPIQQKQKAGIVTSLNDTTLTKAKIRHSGPGWSGVWNLRVVYFAVKHSPPYNKTDLLAFMDVLIHSGGSGPWAKGGGVGGFVLLTLPAFLPSVISSLSTQNKGAPPLGPLLLFYKITKIVRKLWLAERRACMRVCNHGCDVTLSVSPAHFKAVSLTLKNKY